MYINTLNSFLFVAFTNLHNSNFEKIITTDSPKSHNPMKRVVHFIQILSIVLAVVAYYAGIMLIAFAFPLYSILRWHNRPKPTVTCI